MARKDTLPSHSWRYIARVLGQLEATHGATRVTTGRARQLENRLRLTIEATLSTQAKTPEAQLIDAAFRITEGNGAKEETEASQ